MAVANVMKMVKDNEVKFVDFRFTDTRGKEQHVSVPVKAFNPGLECPNLKSVGVLAVQQQEFEIVVAVHERGLSLRPAESFVERFLGEVRTFRSAWFRGLLLVHADNARELII